MLKNKTALVIGGSSGIGRAISIELAKQGADVILASRTKNKIKESVRKIQSFNRKASGMLVDIRKISSIQRLKDEIIKKYDNIDILINSAGISLKKSFKDTTIDEWDNIFNTNIRGQFLMIKTFLSLLKKDAIIINISSILGRYAFKDYSAYCASKFAVIGFSNVLAKELPNKIFIICPGAVNTPMYRKDNCTSSRKVLKPEDIAKKVINLCTGKKKSGSVIEILGKNELFGLAKLWWKLNL